jgi:hypothetical protein
MTQDQRTGAQDVVDVLAAGVIVKPRATSVANDEG